MKKLTKNIFSGFMLASVLAMVAVFSPITPSASAACADKTYTIENGVNCGQGTGTPTELFNGNNSIFRTIVNVLLFIIGAISVIMLIIGGIRYTISNGDSGAVTSAKNTILYAIVGLIIAFLAFAIVNWVLGALPKV
jgi:hypothetical protein